MIFRLPPGAPEVEALKQRMAPTMSQMRALADAGAATELDAVCSQLVALLADPRLPSEFVRALRSQARDLELAANMKACDLALRRAFAFPNEHRKPHRVAAISAARVHLRRVYALGASEQFRRGAERTIEAALLTDGIWPADASGGQAAG